MEQVDEPTSGLDSKTAEDVVVTMRKLAKEGRTLITTIHQPSYKLLQVTIARLFTTSFLPPYFSNCRAVSKRN